MRSFTAITFAGLTLCISINGFATEPTSQPRINNHEASGNLESQHAVGCVNASSLSNKYTPADLYKAVSVCINQGKFKEGALLFALAGTYGRFDTLRVSDRSAHQALSVLKLQTFGNMAPDKQKAFQNSIEKTLGNPQGLATACTEIKHIGPPNYAPRYMIQHGMGAFTRAGNDDGLVKDFNAPAAWKQSLDDYLHCPN